MELKPLLLSSASERIFFLKVFVCYTREGMARKEDAFTGI